MPIPAKMPTAFLIETVKTILKPIWKQTRPQIAKEMLSKKRNARGIIKPSHNPAIDTVWCEYKDQQILKVNPCIRGCLHFNHSAQSMPGAKASILAHFPSL